VTTCIVAESGASEILPVLYYTPLNSSPPAKISSFLWSRPSRGRLFLLFVFSAVQSSGRLVWGSAALCGRFRRLFRTCASLRSPQAPAESRRQPGLAAPQSGGAATKKLFPKPGRKKHSSPVLPPRPGAACLSRCSQCSRTGLVSDAPSGLGLRQNRRALRRIQRGVIQSSTYSLFCLPQTTKFSKSK
jgi:hypothetical protein